MAEVALDAATEEQLEQIHRLARTRIATSDEDAPLEVDAGIAANHVFGILSALTQTGADFAFVHQGTATMILDAVTELGLTEHAVTEAMRKLKKLLA